MIELNEKHKLFADEYIKTLNATESYYVAYGRKLKETTANSNGSRLLRDAKIKAYIDSQIEKAKSERVADAKEVLEYLTSVMRGDTREEHIVIEGTGEGCSEARIVEKKPSEKDRLKAGELLAKRYGLMTEKVEITEKVVQIIDDID